MLTPPKLVGFWRLKQCKALSSAELPAVELNVDACRREQAGYCSKFLREWPLHTAASRHDSGISHVGLSLFKEFVLSTHVVSGIKP